MKACSTSLDTFLQSGVPMYIADLFTFTLLSGTVLRWTSFGVDVTVGGHTWASGGPYLQRSNLRWGLGLTCDPMEIDIQALPTHQVGGVPVLELFANGSLDGADCVLTRMYMPMLSTGLPDLTTGASMGTITLFGGSVADISELGRSHCKLDVKPYTELLNVNIPQDVYGPSCRFVFGDSRCGINRASYAASGAVTAGSTALSINTNLTPMGIIAAPSSAPTLSQFSSSGVNLPYRTYYAVVTYTTALGETVASPESSINMVQNQLCHVASPASVAGATGWNLYIGTAPGAEQLQNAIPLAIGSGWNEPISGLIQSVPAPQIATTGYFALGTVTFNSGANAGLTRGIEGNSGGTLLLRQPLPVAPTAGDTLTAYPDCDRSMSTCNHKYGNLARFGGQPFIPDPATGL